MIPAPRYLALSFLCLLSAVALRPNEQNSSDHRAIDRQIAEGRRLREKGDFLQASALLRRVTEIAHEDGYASGEAHALLAQGACQISLLHYRSALQFLTQAETLGVALGDAAVQGASALNAATAYSELGDFALGLEKAHRAAMLFSRTARQDYITKSLLVYANLQAETGNIDEALTYYSQTIRLSQHAHLPAIEASAWEDQGEALLDANRLTAAEECLQRAYSLRSQEKSLSSLAVTVCNLAELRLKQGRYNESSGFLNQIGRFPSTVLSEIPPYELLKTRGELFAALGRRKLALSQFYKAVLSADRMRASTLPATSLHTIVHLHEVYQDYVELAAQLAIRYHDNALARNALGILARSRAADYRDTIEENLNREGRLPAKYLDLLAQLQEAQAKSTLGEENTRTSRSIADRLRLRLAEMENQLSLQSSSRRLPFKEDHPNRIVSEMQAHLRPTELLLSISLGRKASYLWAVTSRELRLYRLPDRKHIEDLAEAFAQSVRNNNGTSVAGLNLTADLIGQLPPHLLNQPDWLLDADGELLNGIPFSALPIVTSSHGGIEYLVVKHSLRLLPSGDLETIARPKLEIARFLGIADPVYNQADPRWKAIRGAVQPPDTNVMLARLVSSRLEIQAAVKSLHPFSVDLLLGEDATARKFDDALSKKPNIIHFAVHVVSPSGRPQEAALALSLSDKGVIDLLTPETIASYRVSGGLIVLSGCASQQGAILPIVGVIGLSRSWLMAGANAIVVSAWPTPDTDGDFFSRFYRYFRADTVRADSVSRRAAEALRLAQRDLALTDKQHRNAALWAAYSVISID